MTLIGLDLSLSASGVVVLEEGAVLPYVPHSTIGTPGRRPGEEDFAWNARRYQRFSLPLLQILTLYQPTVLAVEVTKHAYHNRRGQEFRAGLGLGTALGWLHAVLATYGAYGDHGLKAVAITSHEAKLRAAGSGGASKSSVKAALEERLQISLEGWSEDEVDALAVARAYLVVQQRDHSLTPFEIMLAKTLDVHLPTPP